jgi:predicted component of type VI protein secretion system
VPKLRVIAGPLAGEQIEVDRNLVVGREADVVIDDPELSRRHLEVRPDPEGLIVEDLGSTNGTFVDERPIDVPTRLGHGDRVTLGVTVLEVEIVLDAGETRLSSVPRDIDATRLRNVPEQTPEPEVLAGAALAAPSLASAPAAAPPPAATPEVAAPAATGRVPEELGVFQPPSVRRRGGLASRSWVPVVLSFGTAILTALALVIYFAQR